MAIITNRATLLTAIADYLARDDLTTFTPNFLQNAENKIYRSLNLRNEETELNVPIGGGVAPIPYRFKKLKYAYIDQSPVRLLQWVPIEDMYRRYPVRTTSSTPCLIAREGNHFVFGPASSDQTLKGIYYQKQRPLEATSETNADEIVEDATTTTHSISQNAVLTDAVHTFSLYAKENVHKPISLRAESVAGGAVTAWALFSLSEGKALHSGGDQLESYFIEDAGNGWYRCSISFDAAAEDTAHSIYLAPAGDNPQPSYLGDVSHSIDLWGAQSEASSFPTEFIRRGGASSTGHKNLLLNSVSFGSAGWTTNNVSVNADNSVAPLEWETPTQNWYTINAPEVLLYGSLLEAESFIMNDERLPIWRSLYDDAVRTLIEEEGNSAVSDGSLYVRSINAA
jgi:hypothetical protein